RTAASPTRDPDGTPPNYRPIGFEQGLKSHASVDLHPHLDVKAYNRLPEIHGHFYYGLNTVFLDVKTKYDPSGNTTPIFFSTLHPVLVFGDGCICV
ncbi:hypothetical protein, partial [Desulfosarcina sp.]|uniref:hypothetical protein n=1 Tax=Desulfosarcina sp. TaxID=2027861 RepID=UPI003566597C